MTSVTHLASHILKLKPEKDAARLSFYNYLKNLMTDSDIVTAEIVETFLTHALTFEHWRQNQKHLIEQTSAILQSADIHLDLLPRQVVAIEDSTNMQKMVVNWIENKDIACERFKVFQDGLARVVAICLYRNQQLCVASFPLLGSIKEGRLEPLFTRHRLHYSPDLSLATETVQALDLGSFMNTSFQVTGGCLQGTITRGYVFQKYQDFAVSDLRQEPLLFYPIKHLEQFFVNRETDPFYQELVLVLQKAIELGRKDSPDSLKIAAAALERGHLALEHIFSDDKLVKHLVRELQYICQNPTHPILSDLTSTSLNVESPADAKLTF